MTPREQYNAWRKLEAARTRIEKAQRAIYAAHTAGRYARATNHATLASSKALEAADYIQEHK